MTHSKRSVTTLACAIFVAACGGPRPPISDSPTPTELISASPAAPSTEPTPTVTVSASPSSVHTAGLAITGRGSCFAINYGSCWPVLLLEPAPARALFDWLPTEYDYEFATDQSYPERTLTGQLLLAPNSIASGRWAVGLGVAYSSDVPSEGISAAVVCVREFDVGEATTRVQIDATFGPRCALDVELEPSPAVSGESVPVPNWTPPDGGISDDCSEKRAILHIDPDGRPWYEEVSSGRRIETIEFWIEGAQAIFDDPPRIENGEMGEHHEWDVVGLSCVFEAGHMAWVGGPDTAWLPWEVALGQGAANAARYAFEVGRGHPGGPPPVAATLTSSSVARLSRETLRQLDSEIRQTGGDRWSLVAPGWYLSNELGSPGQLVDELNSYGHWSVGGSNVDDEWFITPGEAGPALGADGWGARRAWRMETPGGHVVWGLDETITIWEDCSKLVIPPITPGPIEPGVETGLDPDGGLVTAVIDDADRDGTTLVVADITDDACRAHPVVGPWIDHLLDATEAEPG